MRGTLTSTHVSNSATMIYRLLEWGRRVGGPTVSQLFFKYRYFLLCRFNFSLSNEAGWITGNVRPTLAPWNASWSQ